MINKNYYISVIFILVLIFDVVLLRINFKLKADKNIVEEVNNDVMIKNDNLQKQVLKSIFTDIKMLDINSQLYTSVDSFKIEELLNRQNKLVLWFSQMNCRACIDAQYEILLGMINQIGVDNVLLLTSSTNTRVISPFKRINNIPIDIYSTKIEFSTDKMSSSVPFYFILNKNGVISHVFYPDKENGELTKKYLEIIASIFFNVNLQ